MKRFYELTEEQQAETIAFAKRELKDSIKAGLLVPDGPLSDEELTNMALEIAEFGDYDDEGKPFVDPNKGVPFYYFGGCI